MQLRDAMGNGSSFALSLYAVIAIAFGAAVVIHLRKTHVNVSLSTWMFLLLLSSGFSLSYRYFPQHVGIVSFALCCSLAYRSIRSCGVLSPQGKTVLITGCDSGFGLALAKRLHSLGFHVFAMVLHEEGNGGKVLKSFHSDRLVVIQMDVTNWAMVREVEKKIGKQLENKGLYALVNNAGILPCIGDIEIIPTDAYKQSMEVNFFGTVEVTKTFLPWIRRAKGRIVNISSPSGSHRGLWFWGLAGVRRSQGRFPAPGTGGLGPDLARTIAHSPFLPQADPRLTVTGPLIRRDAALQRELIPPHCHCPTRSPANPALPHTGLSKYYEL
ncbi:17-beta-hydroxysteroid dehydrogenase type 2-like isoform X2 [Narcine bancroftii]|uniref:17-beta-hydroxysteroid dehydrogenase type 2-like isoform X2 n=1 Tax=Narcine bancroftii TaxID=1343680 RepID=UPI00383152F0